MYLSICLPIFLALIMLGTRSYIVSVNRYNRIKSINCTTDTYLILIDSHVRIKEQWTVAGFELRTSKDETKYNYIFSGDPSLSFTSTPTTVSATPKLKSVTRN